MGLRTQFRALCIRGATAFGLDQVGLYLSSRRGNCHGVVVAIHETPPSHENLFRRQLSWAAERFSLVDLDRFAQLWERSPILQNNGKPSLLFTFDDGRESNYTVAAPLLESFGARGVFFVVPSFAECSVEQAQDFYWSRVNPGSRKDYDTWEDWRPMTPRQIADLAGRGHSIGNHTLSHASLRGLSRDDMEREIGQSARKISSWTGKPVEAFAWTFGWDAIDSTAWEVIQRYHKFCFAPCPGMVDSRTDLPTLIWRREIEVRYSPAEFRFFYSGLADPAWAIRRRRLRQLLQSLATSAV